MPSIVLRSSDGAEHTVSPKVICLSRTVQRLLDQLPADAGCSDPNGDRDSSLIVPLPNVCDCTLRKVLQYCERSSGHGTEKSGVCPAAAAPALAKQRLEWEQKYMQIEVGELYHLVMAAHYLDVPGLLALCCDAIADAIRNKSAEQIRQHFGLMDNLTAGEVEETTCVNQWAWC